MRRDPRTEVIPGYVAADTTILPPVAPPPAVPAAGRHATQPAGVHRVVRWLEVRRVVQLLHLDSRTERCRALAEVRAPSAASARFLAKCRLATEPTLPRRADMRSLVVTGTHRLGRGHWHVEMAFRTGRRNP